MLGLSNIHTDAGSTASPRYVAEGLHCLTTVF